MFASVRPHATKPEYDPVLHQVSLRRSTGSQFRAFSWWPTAFGPKVQMTVKTDNHFFHARKLTAVNSTASLNRKAHCPRKTRAWRHGKVSTHRAVFDSDLRELNPEVDVYVTLEL